MPYPLLWQLDEEEGDEPPHTLTHARAYISPPKKNKDKKRRSAPYPLLRQLDEKEGDATRQACCCC